MFNNYISKYIIIYVASNNCVIIGAVMMQFKMLTLHTLQVYRVQEIKLLPLSLDIYANLQQFAQQTVQTYIMLDTQSNIYPCIYLENLKYPYVFVVASWGTPALSLGTHLQAVFFIFAALMKFRLSGFSEVVRTLAAVGDENLMKLGKEEAKNRPRKIPGLSDSLSLGQIAICVSNFERSLIRTSC